MDAAVVTLDRTLQRARTRLRLRTLARTLAIGLQVGLATAIPVAVVARVIGFQRWEAATAAVVVGAVPIAGAALIGWVRRGLDPRSVALLVDRLGATDELVLTALHVAGTDDPNRAAILARLASRPVPDMRRLLPLTVPRHLRYAALSTALLIAALVLVPPVLSLPWRVVASPVAREGQRLEDRVAELSSGVELPEPIQRELAELADDLKGDELSAEEARKRMEELQQQLAAFEDHLEPSADLLKDLEEAAQNLDAASTEALSEALQNGDLEGAAEAAKDLSQSLSEASPAERARAAEALTEAGQSLQQSADPNLKQAGEGLETAGEQLASSARPGGSSTSTTPGGETAAGEGLTPQQASDLARELDQARSIGEQLQRDGQALERSQALNGALEGSRQRLGGSPDVAQGASSSEGEGSEGSGDAAGTGTTGGAQGSGSSVGSEGHTWEDQGEHASGAPGAENAADRQSDRRSGTHVDDFQKLYEGLRLKDAESLIAGVDGRLDEAGRIDQLPIRITSGDEDATAPTVVLPAQYRDRAVEAIGAEPIPPAYEHAVKQYFNNDL